MSFVSGPAPGLYALGPLASFSQAFKPVAGLALALLMLGVDADNHHAAFALDDFAFLTNGFHGRFDLHDVNLLLKTLGTPAAAGAFHNTKAPDVTSSAR